MAEEWAQPALPLVASRWQHSNMRLVALTTGAVSSATATRRQSFQKLHKGKRQLSTHLIYISWCMWNLWINHEALGQKYIKYHCLSLIWCCIEQAYFSLQCCRNASHWKPCLSEKAKTSQTGKPFCTALYLFKCFTIIIWYLLYDDTFPPSSLCRQAFFQRAKL